MKAIGIVRKIDPLGRIVLPKETRGLFDINTGDSMEIFVEGSNIILKKYTPACIFCNESNGIKLYKGKNICLCCMSELKHNTF